MTHDQTNAAVAASLGLAPSSAERHGVYPQRSLVPGAERTADDSRRVAPRVHARPGIQAGRDRCPGGPTPHPFQDECTCGHLAGDHQDSRSRSLTPAPPGLCLITDCDCDAFTHADDPVPHRIPHTPRHR